MPDALLVSNAQKDGQILAALVRPEGLLSPDGSLLSVHFRIKGKLTNGDLIQFDTVRLFDPYAESIDLQIEEGVAATERAIPRSYGLAQNFPNPFNAGTEIQYQLPRRDRVTLQIFSLSGQLVRTLVDASVAAGIWSVFWDGRDDKGQDVSSGVYFSRFAVDRTRWTQTVKMVLLNKARNQAQPGSPGLSRTMKKLPGREEREMLRTCFACLGGMPLDARARMAMPLFVLLFAVRVGAESVTVSLPDTAAYAGDTLSVALYIDNASGIAGIEATLSYDPGVLQALETRRTTMTDGFLVADTLSSGQIRVSLARDVGVLSGNGPFMEMVFRVVGPSGTRTDLRLDRMALYDGFDRSGLLIFHP